jgi:hypothetical protein
LNAFIRSIVASVFGGSLPVHLAPVNRSPLFECIIDCIFCLFERILGKTHVGTVFAMD